MFSGQPLITASDFTVTVLVAPTIYVEDLAQQVQKYFFAENRYNPLSQIAFARTRELLGLPRKPMTRRLSGSKNMTQQWSLGQMRNYRIHCNHVGRMTFKAPEAI